MAPEPEDAFAADETVVVNSDGDGPETPRLDAGETRSEEEWPVAEPYRIGSDTQVASASDENRETVVIAAGSASPSGARRRFPPPARFGLLLVAVGAIGAILLAGVVNLLRDGDQEAAANVPVPVVSSSSPTTSRSTPSTSASRGPIALVNIEGMALRDARAVLEQAGLGVRVRHVEADRPRGEILNQSPAAGTEIQRNGLVVLVVSRGAPAQAPESTSVPLPEVVGLAASDAVVALRAAGFDVRTRLVGSAQTGGTVVRQSPAGDTQLSRGSEVVLDIAKSRPAARSLEMPEVAGMTASAARRVLDDAGFTVTVVRVHSHEPVGTVVAQSPRAGSQSRKGAAVTLRVSRGPVTVDVPDVTGLDEQSARLELENAGFRVQVVDEPTADAEKDGIVVGQSPPSGFAADEGGVVTITVGRLD